MPQYFLFGFFGVDFYVVMIFNVLLLFFSLQESDKRVLSKYTGFGLLLKALQKALYEATPRSSLLLNPSLLQNVIYQEEEKAAPSPPLYLLHVYVNIQKLKFSV